MPAPPWRPAPSAPAHAALLELGGAGGADARPLSLLVKPPLPKRSSLPPTVGTAQTCVEAVGALQASPAKPPVPGCGPDACNGTGRREQAALEEVPTTHLSLGSIGHPHSCAAACRYVKRKGGCRDGTRCPNCHLCFWRRDQEKAKEQEVPAPPATASSNSEASKGAAVLSSAASSSVSTLISVGTQGHPYSCAAPCRYVRRKMGCRNGAACPNCHACLWTRELQSAPAGVGHATGPGFFGDSSQALEGLIRLLLSSRGGRAAPAAALAAAPGELSAPCSEGFAGLGSPAAGGPLASDQGASDCRDEQPCNCSPIFRWQRQRRPAPLLPGPGEAGEPCAPPGGHSRSGPAPAIEAGPGCSDVAAQASS